MTPFEIRQAQILETQRELFEWIPVERYLELFPTQTMNAVRQRRYRGTWKEDVHIRTPAGMGTWVNLRAIKELIETRPLTKHPRRPLRE